MRHQEMSLLIIFDAIMTEGSITLAADRLELTQPAVSNALSRMRQAWNDELFIKEGRNIQPTLFAQNLWRQIKSPLNDLSRAVNNEDFDPATSERVFRIAAADTIVDTVWLPLRQMLEQQAPNIAIHAVPFTNMDISTMLHNAEVDLVVGGMLDAPCESIVSEFLYSPCYSCIMRPDHPILEQGLTLETFAQADHLLVSLTGDATSITDVLLGEHKLSRKVAMTVNHFSAVPKIIKNSDLLAVVPTHTVAQSIFDGELAVREAPIAYPAKSVNSYWHRRQDLDKGGIWLRDCVNTIIKDDAQAHFKALEERLCTGNCEAYYKKSESE